MATLIDTVLTYARLGSQTQFQHVDLNRVLTDVLVDLRSDLEGVSSSLDNLPTVFGDEAQLRSVLQNLLANAARYRHPERSPVIGVGARRQGDFWRVEVTDNGRGIAPDHHDRIFDPGYRVDGTEPGFGIGLDTCRRVIEGHGGTIGVDSDGRSGTTVWFELPV